MDDSASPPSTPASTPGNTQVNTQVNPIPSAGISEILGLLEILDDRSGKEKVYTLARDLNLEFGTLLLVIKAAEMLEFVYTPGADVALKALGKKMIEIEMNSKKRILLNQLKKLSLFRYLHDELSRAEDRRMPKEQFLQLLAGVLPKERPEQLFEIIINWGRWGEFLGYSQDDDYVYLDQV